MSGQDGRSVITQASFGCIHYSANTQDHPTTAGEKVNSGDLQCTAMFGVTIWNPLEAGIKGVPLMVPSHEYNRVASNLADALLLALQYVPLEGEDSEKIHKLERAATTPPNATTC